jgi:glutathione synthase
MSSFEFAFLMDPLDGIDIEKDTTYVMMREAERRGHGVTHFTRGDLYLDKGRLMGRLRPVRFTDSERWFSLGEPGERELREMNAIFVRTDPPFNMDYLYATYLLDFIDKEVFVMNSPRGIREANEKLYALNFPEIIPEHIVTSDMGRLKAFLKEVGGAMVVKPLDACGGAGVFACFKGDKNMNAILEMVTADGSRQILAQRYIPEIREGDKRLIVLDGEPIGAVNRVPGADEHRANIHVGARCEKAAITERDRHICEVVSARFAADGIHFAGLDIIGGLVTEINVTSPTGIQEINRLDNSRLEGAVMDFVEKRAAQYLSFR